MNQTPRIIKIQDVGDYARRKVVPSIRLQGKWLEDWGFTPGKQVDIIVINNGVLQVSVKGETYE